MSELKASSILDKPLTSQHWPHLQIIIKGMNDFINQCIKNRQYIDAQKAKDKIAEAYIQIKKRNFSDLQQREKRAIDDVRKKHQDQSIKLNKQWEVCKRKIENQYDQVINKRIDKQQFQKEKHLQQIEIALPLNASPDKQLYQLKHEQDELVKIGNFIQAQRVKVEISKRQQQLSIKNSKLRQSNIKIMMAELQHKHQTQILLLQNKRDQKIKQCETKRRKKQKEMLEKQQRELKQLCWIYGQQKKRFK